MTTYREGPHNAEFIISEANGHRSRENITIPASQEFTPGTILTAAGVPYASGAGPLMIALYGAKTAAGETVGISAIARDAEVNRFCLAWPDGYTDAQKDAAATELAKQGIMVRGVEPASPVPMGASSGPGYEGGLQSRRAGATWPGGVAPAGGVYPGGVAPSPTPVAGSTASSGSTAAPSVQAPGDAPIKS